MCLPRLLKPNRLTNLSFGMFLIFFHQINVTFKWTDAFDRGGLFGKASMSVPNGAFEKHCWLFNIAALQSGVAVVQNHDDDEQLKNAAK